MSATTSTQAEPAADVDPPEVQIGEQLFLETRFAQYFAAHFDGNVNHALSQGDPVMREVQTEQGSVAGPFAGASMNCRNCHFVDELAQGPGVRTYADFTTRSPIPDRGDGHTVTPRNSRNMVDSFLPNSVGILLHADGEFASEASLVKGTLTGRNYGWLPNEYANAVAHVAKVVREDDGTTPLGQQYAGAYGKVLLGTAADIPSELRLPAKYRISVSTATDEDVVNAVSNLIAAYLDSLAFSRDEDDVYDGSPFDLFLSKNDLPPAPAPGETNAQYSQRLLRAIRLLDSPKYVTASEGTFQYHNQQFVFGPQELQGLKLFLTPASESSSASAETGRPLWLFAVPCVGFAMLGFAGRKSSSLLILSSAGVICFLLAACSSSNTVSNGSTGGSGATAEKVEHIGNCVTCHAAPNFTDFKFHNTGATQAEYDAAHGTGTFAALVIPGYDERQADPNAFLPATAQHPNATGRFRTPVTATDASKVDLGMWNVYANPDYPEPQATLRSIMCVNDANCMPQQVLPRTIARFRTPTLRDLGQSDPYLHTGQFDTIEKVLAFYRKASTLARTNQLRNGDSAISGISIDDADAAALAAFLRSLNEDYD
jgi:hypothetical protein